MAGRQAEQADELDASELEQDGPLLRLVAWVCAVGGAIGTLAALVLTIEKIELIKDPTYIPSCSVDSVLSCGSIMSTPQASAFGFPNSLIGIGGFAVVTALGMALLAGARFARWFWVGMQVGVLFGIVFVHWLMVQSLFTIHALCPYCMVVWAVMIPIFWFVTAHNLERGHVPAPASVGAAVARYPVLVAVTWELVVAALVLSMFWSYWMTFFS